MFALPCSEDVSTLTERSYVDKKCRTCKKTKLLHEFDLYNNKRDTSCEDCRNKELDEPPVYYCKCPFPNVTKQDSWIKNILDMDDESLAELIHQGMLKMLQGMHDERSPLDVADIQNKFVNTLFDTGRTPESFKVLPRQVCGQQEIQRRLQ
jgi:hypothetical protein